MAVRFFEGIVFCSLLLLYKFWKLAKIWGKLVFLPFCFSSKPPNSRVATLCVCVPVCACVCVFGKNSAWRPASLCCCWESLIFFFLNEKKYIYNKFLVFFYLRWLIDRQPSVYIIYSLVSLCPIRNTYLNLE